MQFHNYLSLKKELESAGVTLVAVSKTQPPASILKLYKLGQRIFGENRVQELLDKCKELPADIQWHLIGHLQTNKIRQLIPFVSMISSVDSVRLLYTLQKEAAIAHRRIDVLVQIKISSEATKYGFDPWTVIEELTTAKVSDLSALKFRGVMGMASFVNDSSQVHMEFRLLKSLFDDLKKNLFQHEPLFDQICMGMSGDYHIAIEEGSTMVRIGSLIFGERK